MSIEVSNSVVNQGLVAAIYIAPAAGAPMEAFAGVEALAGQGLAADRYALGVGAYSQAKGGKIRHVTLIAAEDIDAANAAAGTGFTWEDTRRNLVTEGIDVNGLVGAQFCIGDVSLRGVELCAPCARPSALSGKKGFRNAFEGGGGLRAEVLASGLIRVGAAIVRQAGA
ncbi:MAG TPA: MOSC domain-containing protein [Candidatus Saccharimonadales bacterium]|nr:MOSC domain-containing protein [Candidatus Saccharimonadales bacterium]